MPDTAPPGTDELATRIVRCIGIWETNRGGDQPAPTESKLNTVAGLPASMATVEQATAPYAVTALKRFAELRNLANPPLTMADVNAADARCSAVVALLNAVTAAGAQNPDDFIAQHASALAATALSQADVKAMFGGAVLKRKIDALAADVKAKRKTVAQAIATLAPAERMGLGEGSLKTYINRPNTWGENRAAWQRKAVAAPPGTVGARIEAIAVSQGGTAFIMPTVRARVNAQFAATPRPGIEQIVNTVAQQNNPGEANYGQNVWATYHRLFA